MTNERLESRYIFWLGLYERNSEFIIILILNPRTAPSNVTTSKNDDKLQTLLSEILEHKINSTGYFFFS